MKNKKLFCLSDEAIEKLKKIAEKNNLSFIADRRSTHYVFKGRG